MGKRRVKEHPKREGDFFALSLFKKNKKRKPIKKYLKK
jgi:hypothetical protein